MLPRNRSFLLHILMVNRHVLPGTNLSDVH